MKPGKLLTAAALALSALGLSACSSAPGNMSEEAASDAGIRTVDANHEIDVPACSVRLQMNGIYDFKIFNFSYGHVSLTGGGTDTVVHFNQIAAGRGQSEVMTAYALLPHEANCPSPQFATPATPVTPAAPAPAATR